MDLTDIGIIVLVTISTFACLRNLYWKFSARPGQIPCRTFIILGSGGHTRELLEYVGFMSPTIFSPRIYVHSKTDPLSRTKAELVEKTMNGGVEHYESITRAREVGQSWITSVFTTSTAMVDSIQILIKWEPELVLCNGPGVCLPICVLARLITVFGLWNVKVVFIESVCRVQKLSLTGLLLRPIVDGFIVQWHELAQKYKGTKFLVPVDH